MIVREAKKNSAISARAIKENLKLHIHERTVRRSLNESGLNNYIAKKKPFINSKNQKKRLLFAKQSRKSLLFAKKYVTKPLSFWERIIWSDESKFELMNKKKRKRVWCKPSDRLKKQNAQPTIKHGGGSVMLWGCFSKTGIGKLVKIEGRITGIDYYNILNNNLLQSAERMSLGSFIFQQDNDPKHTSKVASKFFTEKKIEKLEWLPQSPDLNPIENLWTILDEQIPLSTRNNKESFWQTVQQTWYSLPIDILENLVRSIPKRLQAVIESKGGPTKY